MDQDPRPGPVLRPARIQEKPLKSRTKPGLRRTKLTWRQLFKIRPRQKNKASIRDFFSTKRFKLGQKTKTQPKNGGIFGTLKAKVKPKPKPSPLFTYKTEVKVQKVPEEPATTQTFEQKSVKENFVKLKPKPKSKSRLDSAVRSVMCFIIITVVSEVLCFCLMQLYWACVT
ncbi:hypothetical protein NQD34_014017 [Periophthalmus magnuspinnatus]|nr:hypothetical protein NQD34_014017 [Periophthalmus magnuspinnatus]